MSQRPSGDGPLNKIVRRLNPIKRFTQLGTEAPGRSLNQDTAGAAQPRPPAQGPAAANPAGASAQSAGGAETALPEGRSITIPEAGDTVAGASASAVPPQPGRLLTDVGQSPAAAYWKTHGMMPNFFSLQVMATRRRLEVKLGRRPTGQEISKDLGSRDLSADASNRPTI